MLRLTRRAAAAPVADLEPYEGDVTTTIAQGFPGMYFPGRLERLFEYETENARSRHLVGVGTLWIVIGAFYALAAPPPGPGAARMIGEDAIRLGIVTPILMAVTFAIWWGVRPPIRETLMMLSSIIAPVSIILFIVVADHGDVGASRGALTIVFLFITVVVRLRFWYATAACLAIVAVQLIAPSLLHTPVPGNAPLAIVTMAAALTANYTLEREYRRNYLQRVLLRIQGARLTALVDQLHELSQCDPLTGLANRRALDTQLEELCSSEDRFAAIVIDVDAFKAFNDRYGHQIGDDCLRRIAAMLRASLRRTSDRIARMGGEEFAVLLPQTSLDDAYVIAERMRKSICDLRIPHADSPSGNVVTISAGVAGSNAGASPAELIAEADQALYRAKALGRNRVEKANGEKRSRLAVVA
ncbi:MAG TPA: GGDEF domain-containing protein [Gemmatimonadaceae bacterium]|nr:GGDEF domain-containing protein [Gemmatimonadaceae bacterium]